MVLLWPLKKTPSRLKSYLFGDNKTMENVYKTFFCICVVICASMSLGLVIDFSDSMIFAMAIPNVIGLCVLMPVVRRKLAQYREKMARGEIRRFR